jgi:hypothetical protein
MSDEAAFLTPKELATRWKITHRTLANWRALGKGPPYIMISTKTLYPIEGIHAYETINQSWLQTSRSQETSAETPS